MNVVEMLKREEGVRACVYQDTLGLWTIGCGRLVDPSKPGAGLRPREIDMLLANDISDREQALRLSLPWFDTLDEVRQAVLVGMAFQLGTSSLMGFTNTLNFVRAGRWPEAATAMLASKWAQQTPARAQRMADMMRTGTWTQ
ncbi:COG3772 Phage-related lysozyme (muraminidase) [uncultured Caudovirales phage]|uniref:Lysozyme n=1 Tax=uncultured Caudovirales phage TaxID=2100421 RepID=A0A6J5L0Y5_9CAUD|nr:COG3772 Phage-related lysozyme (muraminidase) [uncultured Caudovirales phage]CAB5194843.1 COG3772 Phage-related lysozyme (muraminidase) [uncultured Caudovirales phage]